MNHEISVIVNGEQYRLTVPSHHTLLQVLREQLVLTGTKNGCEAGECGACAVLLNGEPVNSCLVLAPEADGAEITTIEGLARDGQLDPLQQAIIAAGATQCGYCTPGVLINARALLNRNPGPTDTEIREALVGNLCRCTGYLRIIDAIEAAARGEKEALA
jgi:aerobic carbon-monoxide dehydrogenase small subunit